VKYCKDKKDGRNPLASLEAVLFGGRKYYVENGILDLSRLKIADISEIEGLKQLSHLQTLDLRDNQITEIKGLEHLKNLKSLDLSGNQIKEIKSLERLSLLKTLDLRKNQIAEIGKLEHLNNLQKLDLGMNRITEIKGLEHLTKLKELILFDNQIKEIKGLDNLINLHDLNLRKNQIKEIKGLDNLINLHDLNLKENQIKEVERDLIEESAQELVKYCQEKKESKVDMPFVTVEGIKYAVDDSTLDLSGIGITDIDEIDGLSELTNLQVLLLENNQIEEINGLEHLTNLQKLNLSKNHIKEIKGLENLTKLYYLELSDNQIEEIKELKYLINLRILYLHRNQIKEIKGLENLTNLQELYIGNNPLREDERYLSWRSAQDVVKYCQDKKEGKIEPLSLLGNIFPIPCIEKPSIQIEMDIGIESDMDWHVAGIFALLDPEEYDDFSHPPKLIESTPSNMIPAELERLKKEYLKVIDIAPDFSYSQDKKSLLITYRSEQDLTLSQFDDLLTAIVNKFRTVIIDLYQPRGRAAITRKFILHKLKEASEEKANAKTEEEDRYTIKRITVHETPEQGLVLKVFDKMIDHIKSHDVLEDLFSRHTYWECLIDYFGLLIDLVDRFEGIGKRGWVEDEKITYFVAEKLDEFLDEIRRNFELKLKPDRERSTPK